MKKPCFALLLALVLLLSCLPVSADTFTVTYEEKTLMTGLTYRHYAELLDNGWQDIYVVQADLTQPHLKFDVLSNPEGKSYLQNTYESAKAFDALAAVNADFFAAKKGESGRGSAIGLEIKAGEMLTSPAAYESMNAIYQLSESDVLSFAPFTYEFTVTAPDGTSSPINVINKYDDMSGIVLYTKDWGKETIGSSGDLLEVVVEDGVVTAKNRDVGPVPIPENGYVLMCDLGIHTFLDDHLQVEDKIELSITTTPNFEDIETAVGGGGMILVDGKIPSEYSHTIAGTHPRTAVGLDQKGTRLTMVVVDGRRTGAAGMTMVQLGYLMAELGCYNAMNLDGGGSSLMALKADDGSHIVANSPSDNYKRPVTNSIGILADAVAPAKLSGLRLTAEDRVFADTSVWIDAHTLDQYARVMGVAEPNQITWTLVSGKGLVKDNYFYPTAPGRATVRATYGGFSDEVSFTVLDAPARLAFSANAVSLNKGESKVLWLTGYDEFGRSATIYPKDIRMTALNPQIAKVSQNSALGISRGSTIITASMGSVAANVAVAVDGAASISAPKGASMPDPQEKSAALSAGGFRFTVFGNTRKQEKFFDIYLNNAVTKALKKEDGNHFFVGNNVDTSLLTRLGDKVKTADGFSKFTQGNSTFITLKNGTSTSLFAGGKTQWSQLEQAVSALSSGNLFVFLNDHNISPISAEVTVFKRLMEQAAAKCANVYVFGGGWVNETLMENGVRYVTTIGVFPSVGHKPEDTNISFVKYYLVTVNGDQVTYETKSIK